MKFIKSLLTVALPLFLLNSCVSGQNDLDLSAYEYRDTKNLVKFVYDAAKILEQKGIKAFSHFNSNRKLYRLNNYYLYIYETNGTNIFHAGITEFEGHNLMDIQDLQGKKITNAVLEALENPNNPHGWVHYTWWEPGKFFPESKSSCNVKVITPEGKELFVGAGLNQPHEEKEFVRICVDTAVDLIKKEGSNAFDKIRDPLSQFVFRNIRVFVFYENGEIVISPTINNCQIQHNIIDSKDEVGHFPFKKALKTLATHNKTWEVFMAKNRDKRILIKKALYLRKLQFNNRTLLVGAVTDLPRPSWSN